jgi:hypothetical protein
MAIIERCLRPSHKDMKGWRLPLWCESRPPRKQSQVSALLHTSTW